MKQLFQSLFVAFAAVFMFTFIGHTQTMGQPEDFSAGAIDLNGMRATTGQVDINVDRWSTPAERQKLLAALKESSSEGLLKALQSTKEVGRIHTPDSIGYTLRYASQHPGKDGGRDIVLVTDRPISFWEAVNRPRSVDYPFTLIQMHINKDGKGEGKLAIATRITSDPDTKEIEIEDYANQPIRLVDVQSRPRRLSENSR